MIDNKIIALDKNQIEAEKKAALISDLQAMLEEETEAKEPKNPKEYVILISDPNGAINTDLVGWPIQIPEGDDPATVVERISKVAAEYNNSRKGKKTPATSIGDTIEGLVLNSSRKMRFGASQRACAGYETAPQNCKKSIKN